jgi:hypothetical protein
VSRITSAYKQEQALKQRREHLTTRELSRLVMRKVMKSRHQSWVS